LYEPPVKALKLKIPVSKTWGVTLHDQPQMNSLSLRMTFGNYFRMAFGNCRS
jgi:hypothetical protein